MADVAEQDIRYMVVKAGRRRVCVYILRGIALVFAIAVGYLALRFLPDQPLVYTENPAPFKHGSIGAENGAGIPYWIFLVPLAVHRAPAARAKRCADLFFCPSTQHSDLLDCSCMLDTCGVGCCAWRAQVANWCRERLDLVLPEGSLDGHRRRAT